MQIGPFIIKLLLPNANCYVKKSKTTFLQLIIFLLSEINHHGGQTHVGPHDHTLSQLYKPSHIRYTVW